MDNKGKRRKSLENVKRIESQIALLDRQKKKLIGELRALREEIHITDLQNNNIIPDEERNPSELSAVDKTSLFRSLFRGREDVYACLWTSKKSGKTGYSPVCKNEWVRGICKKPIMKCSQCPNREFLPLSDAVICKHLEGAYVVGIYPMLQVDDRIADYGFVIVDECHHISAVSFERVLMETKAKYILGLTATPYRRDGHQPIIHMQCGPICYQGKQKDFTQQISKYLIIPRLTKFVCEWSSESNIYDLWPKLINDRKRNELIVNDVIKAVQEGRFPIVLTERRKHLKVLGDMLQEKIEYLAVLYGGLRARERREILKKLRNCPDGKKKAILATGSYIGEGFDEPRLDTLFITMPISFKEKVVQYAGRLHRSYCGKEEIRIYDYVDEEVPVLLGMYRKRTKTYKTIGYETQTVLL